MSYKIDISGAVKGAFDQVSAELPARAFRASIELRNALQEVMSGNRSGRIYRTPSGGRYTASAPGEPPAVRTGILRGSWRPVQHGPGGINPTIESNTPYAWLDVGSPHGMIAPRPYSKKTIEMAWPQVEAIYAEPFHIDT
jgi:hypothetical protein